MNTPITLTELVIKKMDIVNESDLANSVSGLLSIEATAAYGEIKEGKNDNCIVYHDLSLHIQGRPHQTEEPIFTVNIEATGQFMASLKDVEKARRDEETQACVSSVIADAMFLGMRAYIDQSFSMMGLKNVPMPWSFKLEQPATLK